MKYHESKDNILATQPLREVCNYQHHSGMASRLTYSRSGSTLATCGGTHVELYRENRITESVETDSQVRSIRFTADSQTLIGGCTGGVVVWDVADGNRRHEIKGSPVLSVDVSNDSKLFASGSSDKLVRLFNTSSGKLAKSFGESAAEKGVVPVHTVSFCPTPTPAHIAASDSIVRIWDIESNGEPISKFGSQVTTGCYSNDSRVIATGDSNGNVSAFDIRSASKEAAIKFDIHAGSYVKSVAYTPCNRWILSGTNDGNLAFCDLRLGLPVMLIDVGILPIESVAHNPAMRTFTAAISNGITKVWSYSN